MNKFILSALLFTGCYVPEPITMEIDQLVIEMQYDDKSYITDIYTISHIVTQGLPPGLEEVVAEVTVNDIESYDEYCYSDNYGNLLCTASLVYDYSFACGTAVNYTIVVEYDGVEYEMSQMVTPEGSCQ